MINHMDANWMVGPLQPQLSEREIQLWRFNLNLPDTTLAELEGFLNPEELLKSKRYIFEKDRRRFVVARAGLRLLLGRYLGLAPLDVQFTYNPYGKPGLALASGNFALEFNISHSGELALFAIVRRRRIGVDLEFMNPGIDYRVVIEHNFTPVERTALLALPQIYHLEAFYNGWTRKEAFIKARGEGLSFPLARFDVSLAPGHPAAILDIRSAEGRPGEESWSIYDIPVYPDYKAALVIEGPIQEWKLRYWQLALKEL